MDKRLSWSSEEGGFPEYHAKWSSPSPNPAFYSTAVDNKGYKSKYPQFSHSPNRSTNFQVESDDDETKSSETVRIGGEDLTSNEVGNRIIKDYSTIPFHIEESDEKETSGWKKTLAFIWMILPSIMFTIVAHLVSWMTAEFHPYLIAFFIFQGILWPSLVFGTWRKLCFSLKRNICNILCNEWRTFFIVIILGILGSGSVFLLTTSLYYLNITVALALSFIPVTFIAFISHINDEKRFSIPLLLTGFLTYCGIALIAIPIIIVKNKYEKRYLYTGLGASMGSFLLAIPSSFLLTHLRKKDIDDSVVGALIGMIGTIFGFAVGISMNAVKMPRLENDIWWAVGLFLATFLGLLFALVETRVLITPNAKVGGNEKGFVPISQIRIITFISSCIIEIICLLFINDIRPRFYDIFNVFGVLLILFGFFLTISYEKWYRTMKEENMNATVKNPRNFISWIFSN